jgi:hypothetical protein
MTIFFAAPVVSMHGLAVTTVEEHGIALAILKFLIFLLPLFEIEISYFLDFP